MTFRYVLVALSWLLVSTSASFGQSTNTSEPDREGDDYDFWNDIDASTAAPGSSLYAGGSVGIAYFHEIEGADYDLGLAASGLIGFQFRRGWRAELDLNYESAEFQNSADATSLFAINASLHADLENWKGWTPYVGGGVGIVDIDVGNDEDNTELSGHIDGGVTLPLNDTMDFVPGLRVEYILLDNIDDQVITQLRAGFRWHR